MKVYVALSVFAILAAIACAVVPPQQCQEAATNAKHYGSCGCPYVFGGDSCGCGGSGGLDCSGLVYVSYQQAGYTGITRTTSTQIHQGSSCAAGCSPSNPSACSIGDLFFYCFAKPCPDHVLMYIGNGLVAECPHTGLNCRVIKPYTEDYYACRSICGGSNSTSTTQTAGPTSGQNTATSGQNTATSSGQNTASSGQNTASSGPGNTASASSGQNTASSGQNTAIASSGQNTASSGQNTASSGQNTATASSGQNTASSGQTATASSGQNVATSSGQTSSGQNTATATSGGQTNGQTAGNTASSGSANGQNVATSSGRTSSSNGGSNNGGSSGGEQYAAHDLFEIKKN